MLIRCTCLSLWVGSKIACDFAYENPPKTGVVFFPREGPMVMYPQQIVAQNLQLPTYSISYLMYSHCIGRLGSSRVPSRTFAVTLMQRYLTPCYLYASLPNAATLAHCTIGAAVSFFSFSLSLLIKKNRFYCEHIEYQSAIEWRAVLSFAE